MVITNLVEGSLGLSESFRPNSGGCDGGGEGFGSGSKTRGETVEEDGVKSTGSTVHVYLDLRNGGAERMRQIECETKRRAETKNEPAQREKESQR